MSFREAMIRRVRARPLLKSIRQVKIAVSENYWDHYFVEYYKGYRIDHFSTLGPNMHGIYVGTADPETIPKAPPDPNFDYADWVFYDGLNYAKAGIDNWVMDPVYVQHYPDVTWATHADPGWDIYQEPAGGMRYYALDTATGNQVGTWWTSDNLQGLLDWLCETQVPAGQIGFHQGIPITFYPEKTVSPYPTLYHVYEATVAGHTKRFDNWRLEDCKTWIEAELAKPKETSIKVLAPERTPPGLPFDVSGNLKREIYVNGHAFQPFTEQTIDLSYNGVSLGSATTDTNGNYSKSVTVDELGVFILKASYAGTDMYLPSEAETTVKTGPSGRPIRDLLRERFPNIFSISLRAGKR